MLSSGWKLDISVNNWSMYPTAWMTDNILSAVHWRLLQTETCAHGPNVPLTSRGFIITADDMVNTYESIPESRVKDHIAIWKDDVQTQKGTCDCGLSHATCLANGYTQLFDQRNVKSPLHIMRVEHLRNTVRDCQHLRFANEYTTLTITSRVNFKILNHFYCFWQRQYLSDPSKAWKFPLWHHAQCRTRSTSCQVWL